MRTISDSVYELLMIQGLANRPVGAGKVRGIGAGLREGADRPATAQPDRRREPMGIKTGERTTALHPELRQREEAADLNSGKGPGVNAPAKFTVLTCKAPNAHGRRKKAPGTYLRLVWSR